MKANMRKVPMIKTSTIKGALFSALLILFPLTLTGQTASQNLLDTLNEQGDLGEAVLSDLTYSSNTESGHPAAFLLDGDDSSWYGWESYADRGWVSLEFSDEIYLEGLTVEGYLPDGVVLSLHTTVEEETVTLPAGYILSGGTDFYLDLSRERLLLDNLTLTVEGEDISSVQISEIALQAYSPGEELFKRTLIPEEMDYSRKDLNDYYALVDGNIGTEWHNENGGFGSMIYWYAQNALQGEYHAFDDWTTTDEIVLNGVAEGEAELLKFYLGSEACGTLDLSLKVEGEWIAGESFELSGLSGWVR
ncbi:MAG: hypothetical protein PQJ60_05455, partial [Spirochaetales bacterium]|nr:hypothetical protein [Spirochaetales bacterium]